MLVINKKSDVQKELRSLMKTDVFSRLVICILYKTAHQYG